ncbi:MAG: methyltransferase domain-containing protein [Vagococcus sp.]
MLKKKIVYAKEFLEDTFNLFQCPKCHSPFIEVKGTSLVCSNHHQFDLSKKGTIHFPSHHMTSDYDKSMLMHRRDMILRDLYRPILDKVYESLPPLDANSMMVDMGCGEGSFLKKLSQDYQVPGYKVGFDLSKEGIQLASDYADIGFWFIGDVTNMPFQANSVDVLLNIFSPSHYDEMLRVLKPDGVMVKVIPETNYLKEMRDIFYQDNKERLAYSNENVYEKFKKDVNIVKEERLTYSFPVETLYYEDILKMSPIHWGATETAKTYAANHPFETLTIDVKILIGKN